MGDKQIRTKAEQDGVEELRPQFDALGDLVVAAEAAGQAPALLAAADVEAERIRAEARAKTEQLNATWREKWDGALRAGWTAKQLSGGNIGQQPPPKPRRRRAPAAPQSGTTKQATPLPGTG